MLLGSHAKVGYALTGDWLILYKRYPLKAELEAPALRHALKPARA